MKLELAGIIDKPGASVPFDYTIDLSGLEINFCSPFPRPLAVRGEVYNAAGVLTLEATIEGEIEFDCARCSEHVVRDYVLDIDAVLVDELANPDDFDNSDVVVLSADSSLELDEVLRDTVILESEMLFLCREDCAGVCPTCGKNLNEGECSCSKQTADPRLDALRALLERKKSEGAE